MTSSVSSSTRRASHWLPFFLIIAALTLRTARQHGLFASTANFSPLMALAFTGTIVFPQAIKWWHWALMLVLSDVFSLGAASVLHFESLAPYACFALAAFFGGRMRSRTGLLGAIVGVLACSAAFYLVTNTAAWLASSVYAKDVFGWVQALTTGTPGYPSTFEFFRNSLVSDLLGTVLLLAAYNTESLLRNLRTMPVFAGRGGELTLA